MSSMRSKPRSPLHLQARSLLPVLSAALVLAISLPLAAQTGSEKPQSQSTEGGPGTGDPGQGRDPVGMQLGTRDLALAEPFRIGTESMAWGTTASLPASTAAFRQNGACGFRFAYPTRNAGTVPTPATINRLHRDTQAGPVMAVSPLPALAVGAQAVSSGHVLLKPGTWLLYARADATGQVTETNEANNLRRVRVTVTGSCAG